MDLLLRQGHAVVGVDNLNDAYDVRLKHWRLERMNVMDRLILRLAVYEFLHEPATPGKVIIYEALELADQLIAKERAATKAAAN